jgi:putative oxidoreductase
MIMAWATAHAGKPIWVTSGGAELPLMYLNNATALLLAGPGRFSLDKALGIKVPTLFAALTAIGVMAGLAMGILTHQQHAGTEEQATSESNEAQAAPSPEQASSAMSEGVETVEELQAREVGSD